MINFIDKTATSNGTPLNRANMMAIQGFQYKEISFDANGDIYEKYADNSVHKIAFKSDGSIYEEFSNADGTMKITKNTTFNSNGSIKEEIF